MAIDPKLPIPVYFQLKTLLLEEILDGRYGPDGRLPTEHQLCERHGISRTPVTRALSELAAEGVVIRHRRRGTEASPGRGDWGEVIAETWRALPVDPELGLVAGEENPADDPASLPYLLSTQVLLWYTATRLRAHAGELGLAARVLAETADTVRAAIRDRFVCPGPFGGQWAYETDGRGRHRRYQDANDLPTVLAPLWGLCGPEDRQWSATMRFALDPANPGWTPGPWGGLGSAHTPGTWPLGDIQEWVATSLLGETGRAGRALDRLLAVAAPDGLLPEAYDPETGRWLARHWFAWPSAALGALALGAWDAGLGGASGG